MLIKNMLDDVGDEMIRQDNPIPIPNVRPHADADALFLQTSAAFY